MDKQLYTAGFMSQILQQSPSELESDLREVGYHPELVINDIPHWSVDCLIYLRRKSQRMNALTEGQKTNG